MTRLYHEVLSLTKTPGGDMSNGLKTGLAAVYSVHRKERASAWYFFGRAAKTLTMRGFQRRCSAGVPARGFATGPGVAGFVVTRVSGSTPF
jgi:hypothetical protein